MVKRDLRDVRTDYEKFELRDEDVTGSPVELFTSWLDEASQVVGKDHNAMVVSSYGERGPSSRVVLLREFSDEGFMFYTNKASSKARDFKNDPRVALNFFWSALERQVRVEGAIVETSQDESEDYFRTRPRASKLSAWASVQSEKVNDRKTLEDQLKKVSAQFEGGEVPLPPFWGGFRVLPNRIEFWQGRSGRLHDRIVFELIDDSWVRYRIQP